MMVVKLSKCSLISLSRLRRTRHDLRMSLSKYTELNHTVPEQDSVMIAFDVHADFSAVHLQPSISCHQIAPLTLLRHWCT